MAKKRKRLPARVKKIIKPTVPGESEKAEINIPAADELYREIRIENTVANGEKAKLKEGADVDVIVEADSNATIKKPA